MFLVAFAALAAKVSTSSLHRKKQVCNLYSHISIPCSNSVEETSNKLLYTSSTLLQTATDSSIARMNFLQISANNFKSNNTRQAVSQL